MRKQKIVIGIQCRLSSSRLPGKALLRVGNSTVLGFLVKRALSSGLPVYLLTSDQPEDDLVVREAHNAGVMGVIRGPLNNVIKRFEMLACEVSCDYIVRVTADNPLTEFGFIGPLLDILDQDSCDYACVDLSRCPEGLNLEIVSVSSLLRAVSEDPSDYNCEHVTPWLKQQSGAVNHFWKNSVAFAIYDQLSDYSFTIDNFADYVNVASLINLSFRVNGIHCTHEDFVRHTVSLVLDPSISYGIRRNTF